jgi:hypothetical protein
MNYTGPLTQEAIRAYVAQQWPDAMRSPLAQSVREFVAADEADRAIGFANLQAHAASTEAAQMRADAMEHARRCIEECNARGIAYDAETLGHNIESSFFDLDSDECDEIAAQAIKRFASPA